MQDTILVVGGVAELVARYPADERSFSDAGTVVKAAPGSVSPGMLWDGSTFTDPPPAPGP